MSVELPPPQVPQNAAIAQVQTGAAAVTTTLFGRPIHLSGAPLDARAIEQALGQGSTLVEAMRKLAAACYGAGYPAAQVLYAEQGSDIYVLVQPGHVTAVQAPEHLQKYFQDLVGVDPLLASSFEPDRVLASLHADRAGIYSEPHFVPDGSGGSVLQLKEDNREAPVAASLQFSNYGNRFAGRYLGQAKAALGDPWGDEFSFSWLEGLTALDDDATASSYHAPQLGWTRVTTLGQFGAQARYVTYNYEQRRFALFGTPDRLSLKGEVLVPQVSWLLVPLSDFDRRWSLQALVDYTDNHLTNRETGEEARESYATVEADSSFYRQFELGSHEGKIEAALNLRKGLGDSPTGRFSSDLDYFLGRPTLNLRMDWGDNFTSHVGATAQFTDNRLPEQEQFVLGGIDNLSAWLPGVGIGDNGFVVMADTLYRMKLFGQPLKPRMFVEYGETSFRHPISVVVSGITYTQAGHQSLADAGVELGMTLAKHLDVTLSGAWGFHASDIDQGTLDATDARMLFSLKLSL